MSNNPIEGEPAFPNGPYDGFQACFGLSERRYYIGQALAGFCANPDMTDNDIDTMAALAIQQADSLMFLLYSANTSEPDKPETLQAVEPPPDHRQLAVGELKRPADLLQLLDGTFMTIDCYGESGKLVQVGEIRFRKNKFKLGDQVVYTPSASAFATENEVWKVTGFGEPGVYSISRRLRGKVTVKAVRAEEIAPIDHECPF